MKIIVLYIKSRCQW